MKDTLKDYLQELQDRQSAEQEIEAGTAKNDESSSQEKVDATKFDPEADADEEHKLEEEAKLQAASKKEDTQGKDK